MEETRAVGGQYAVSKKKRTCHKVWAATTVINDKHPVPPDKKVGPNKLSSITRWRTGKGDQGECKTNKTMKGRKWSLGYACRGGKATGGKRAEKKCAKGGMRPDGKAWVSGKKRKLPVRKRLGKPKNTKVEAN